MNLKEGASLYFLGIGGTGMAAVAGLCQEAGYKVTGSDAGIYPPMSTMLDELGIPVSTPYAVKNLADQTPDLVVIANVLSRGNVELEHVIERGLPYTSFPKLLGDFFLSKRVTAVVTGTHGKTTTAALLAHILHELGEKPGFLIGGLPRNFPRSFRVGEGKVFVIEGDEYDTAFFDKGPKFLHYHPKHLILNNLEFDHADIYENVEAIERQFKKLLELVPEPSRLIANMDDTGIRKLVTEANLAGEVTRVATRGESSDCDVSLASYKAGLDPNGLPLWSAILETKALGTVCLETLLSGRHNLANVAQVVACLISMENSGDLTHKLDATRVARAIRSFQSVRRRLDRLGSFGGIDVYEDFAHHPTAVGQVIEGFREVFPDRRLVIAFEPRSATQRRNIFQNDYAKMLALADRIYIGECPLDKRIPEGERMNTAALESAIGSKARAFPSNDALLNGLKDDVESGDAIIFMSSGSFSGAQHRLAEDLRLRFG